MRMTIAIALVAALAAMPPAAHADPDPAIDDRVLLVRPGDTLARLLDNAGIDDAAAAAAIASLAPLYRPSALRPGDEVALRVSTSDPNPAAPSAPAAPPTAPGARNSMSPRASASSPAPRARWMAASSPP